MSWSNCHLQGRETNGGSRALDLSRRNECLTNYNVDEFFRTVLAAFIIARDIVVFILSYLPFPFLLLQLLLEIFGFFTNKVNYQRYELNCSTCLWNLFFVGFWANCKNAKKEKNKTTTRPTAHYRAIIATTLRKITSIQLQETKYNSQGSIFCYGLAKTKNVRRLIGYYAHGY